MQYVLRFFMFLRIHFYLRMFPKMIPRRPQEGLKMPQEEPPRDEEGPKTAPGQPQDSSRTP